MVLIFRKTLKKTDVSGKLSVQTKSLKEFPPFQGSQRYQFLMFEDGTRNRFRCRLSIRKAGYQKPVLSTGWSRVVASMNLQVGDDILFIKDVDDATGEVTYKIRRLYQFL